MQMHAERLKLAFRQSQLSFMLLSMKHNFGITKLARSECLKSEKKNIYIFYLFIHSVSITFACFPFGLYIYIYAFCIAFFSQFQPAFTSQFVHNHALLIEYELV